MLEIAIMVEGQNGLNWERWQRLASAVESLGFAGLYRSDHYTNSNPPDLDSLELWTSLTWLASHTSRIEFGPLVSPMSFRHPTITARMAAAVDDLSGGRLQLGLGAGWQEREHAIFGLDLLEVPARFQRFEEGVAVIKMLLNSDAPVNFAGTYYHLHEAQLLPRPQRPNGPPIVLGGNGPLRTLPLVARYADEWNAVYLPVERFQTLNQTLDELIARQGRQPGDVKRSLMTGFYFGLSESDIEQRLQTRRRTFAEMRRLGIVLGTASQVVDQLGELAEAGIARVMLQWLELDEIDRLEAFANQVLPQLKA